MRIGQYLDSPGSTRYVASAQHMVMPLSSSCKPLCFFVLCKPDAIFLKGSTSQTDFSTATARILLTSNCPDYLIYRL
jgi:hypothetical protein